MRVQILIRSLVLVGVLVSALAAAQFTGGGGPSSNQVLTDPGVLAIYFALDDAELQAAKLARSKGTDGAVRAFAEDVIREDEAARKQLDSLQGQLHLRPRGNFTADGFRRIGAEKFSELKKLSGAALDAAFMSQEVERSRRMSEELFMELVPNAQLPQLRTYFQAMKPAFDARRARAEALQAQLARSGAPPH